MSTSSDQRIRATHVGSLPRPLALTTELMARENQTDFEPERFEATVAAAVRDAVSRQVELGIDVVSDGEMSKISYATYVKDRLSGFDGDVARQPAKDLADHPEFASRMARFAGEQRFKRQTCVGPVSYIGHADLAADLTRLRSAAQDYGADACFVNAASPGLVSAFQGNTYYPTHEAYVEAVGEAMQLEYEAIVGAGFLLQVDCPDLAMSRHTGFQDLSDQQFLERSHHAVEVLNHALRNIDPAHIRMHVCWGNYEGPHDHDVELQVILPVVLSAKPSHVLFEAANPRHAHEWEVWHSAKIPADKILVPGVIASTTNYVEHPELVAQRLEHFVRQVGSDRVIAGTDCGFGTFAGVGRVDAQIAYKKLASLSIGARLLSARLQRSNRRGRATSHS